MPEETGEFSRLKAALASRYRIDRELGQGGIATVFLAHDLRHDRDVALKVLRLRGECRQRERGRTGPRKRRVRHTPRGERT